MANFDTTLGNESQVLYKDFGMSGQIESWIKYLYRDIKLYAQKRHENPQNHVKPTIYRSKALDENPIISVNLTNDIMVRSYLIYGIELKLEWDIVNINVD